MPTKSRSKSPTVRRSARRSHLQVPRQTRPRAGSRPAARAVSKSPGRFKSPGPVKRSRSAERVAGKQVPDSWSIDWRPLVLSLNYLGVCILALYMIAWILHFPATWRAGNPDHDAVTAAAIEEATGLGVVGPGQFRLPASVLTKYADHPVVQYTHILPGAIWSAAIPFQFNPAMRKQYPKLHRAVGCAFFACSFSIVGGLTIIHARELYWFVHDFGIPARVPGNPEVADSGSTLGAKVFGAWFATTACVALRAAKRRDFASHKRWVYRHVGAGIWVALQRILLEYADNTTPELQKANFGHGAAVGGLITVLSAELAVLALPPRT
jgi:hypothetical protein